jgi:hypothetical protein
MSIFGKVKKVVKDIEKDAYGVKEAGEADAAYSKRNLIGSIKEAGLWGTPGAVGGAVYGEMSDEGTIESAFNGFGATASISGAAMLFNKNLRGKNALSDAAKLMGATEHGKNAVKGLILGSTAGGILGYGANVDMRETNKRIKEANPEWEPGADFSRNMGSSIGSIMGLGAGAAIGYAGSRFSKPAKKIYSSFSRDKASDQAKVDAVANAFEKMKNKL